MATRFRIVSTFKPGAIVAFSAGWNVTSAAVRQGLVRGKPQLSTATSITGTDTSATTAENVLLVQAVSEPLQAQTISGTFKGQFRTDESNVAADSRSQTRAYVVSADGSTVRGVLWELDTAALSNEWALSTLTNRKFPVGWTGAGATLSSVTCQAGDRIVIELGFRTHNTTSTTYSGVISIGDPSATDLPEDETTTTASSGWIEFSQTLNFQPEISADSPVRVSGALDNPNQQDGTGKFVARSAWKSGTMPSDPLAPPSADRSPPTVGAISPTSGSTITNTQAIAFTVSDDNVLVSMTVLVKYPSTGVEEVVYKNGAFASGYNTLSSVVISGGGTGYAFSILRNTYWIDSPTIFIQPSDAGGTAPITQLVYTLSSTIGPSVSNLSPGVGSISQTAAVSFDLNYVSTLTKYVVEVSFGGSRYEVIYDSTGFTSHYSGASTVSSGTKKLTFSLTRDTGWIADPTFRIVAADADGYSINPTYAYTLSGTSGPSISNLSPGVGSLSQTAAVSFDLNYVSNLTKYTVEVSFSGGKYETIYDSTGFSTRYSGNSSVSAGTKKFTFSLKRDTGWIADPTFRIVASDADGYSINPTYAYTLTGTSGPSISNVSPGVGTIAQNATLTFDLNYVSTLQEYAVLISFSGGKYETAYDSAGWSSKYSGASTIVAGTKKLSFSITRSGGWAASFAMRVVAVDADGYGINPTYAYTISGTSAPTVTGLSPTAPGSIAAAGAVSFDLNYLSTLLLQTVEVEFPSIGKFEVVYDGGFSSRYASSNRTPGSNKYSYVIQRTGGWPSSPIVHVTAVDSEGNLFSQTYSYTLSGGAGAGPIVSSLSPAVPGPLTLMQAVSFDITDLSTLLGVTIGVEYPDIGRYDVAYDGDAWSDDYSTNSTIDPISGGFALSILRNSGWLINPIIHVTAFDDDGFTFTDSYAYTLEYTLPTPIRAATGGSYGLGDYGTSPWGIGARIAPPKLFDASPAVADVAGGTVITLAGDNFDDSLEVELLLGGQTVGTGIIADAEFDIVRNKAYVGMPALAAGFYDLRVRTTGGEFTLSNAVEFRPFANEYKVETVRRKWSQTWQLGPRILGAGG